MKLVANTEPKRTLVVPVKPEPVIVTVVPPAVGPDVGEIPVIVGIGALKVNMSAGTAALVPPEVVTKTFLPPLASAGEVAAICVSDTTVKLAAAAGPNATLVVPVKPEPVMVTMVPPAVGPTDGTIPLMTGIGAE